MQKAVLISALSILALSVISGCSSEPKKTGNTNVLVADCVFPNTEKPAPGWICDQPVAGVPVSAVGVAEPSKGGISFMKDIAAADGRGRLAEQMQIRVSKMVKKYLGNTGVAKTETIDAVTSSTIKTVTDQQLIGSKIYKTRTGPKGRLFALVGIDAKNAEKIAEQAVRTSMANDKALWQQFKAKQSFDEMAKEISKEPVN